MEDNPKNKLHSKLTALSGASLLALSVAMPMNYAYAQESDDNDDVEEIVVTGIRSALKSARDMKRNADTAVDSITASDASGLPDLSVAEALARVPGVVVQRFGLAANDGDFPSPEGAANLVRGLSLVRSEFNGRDAFTANGGRSLDFGSIPPELIGSVEVFKNASADQIQGGIGGTINLRTLEPFDSEDRVAVVTVDGTYTDLRNKISPDVSVILGDRWELSGGEFGVLASFSTSELKSDLNGFQIGQLYPLDLDGETIAVPGGWQLRTNEVDRKRDSFYGAVQWRNNDETLEISAKYYRTKNKVISDERTLEWFGDGESWAMTEVLGDYTTSPFTSAGIPQCNGSGDPTPAAPTCEMTQSVTGLFESGLVSNSLRDWMGASGAHAATLGIHQEEESMTDDFSINIKWNPSERLSVNLDAHRTSAKFDQTRLWSGTRQFTDFMLNADLDDPRVTLYPTSDNNPNRRFADGTNCSWGACDPLSSEFADPANSFLMFAADEFHDNEGDMKAFKGDVEYDFDNDSWFESVKFGARFAERDQVNRHAGLNWAGLAPPWDGGSGNTYLPMSELSIASHEMVDYSDFYRGGVVTGDHTDIVFVDRELLSDYDAFTSMVANEPLITEPGGAYGPDWDPLRKDGVVDWSRGTIGDVIEKTTDFYVRLDFGNDFSNGMSLDGNVGVRYTKSTVSGIGEFAYVNIENNAAAGDNPIDYVPETVAYMDQANGQLSGQFNSTDYWLPSLNLKWNLNEDQLIRFAASKAITRPNINQLRSSQTAHANLRRVVDNSIVPPKLEDITLSQISINGGNPDLVPIESWNFDLSYEYYFGEQDSFTFGLFTKSLSKNIIYSSVTVDTVTLDGSQVAVVYNGDLNQDNAKIKGFEVAYQQFFDQLPGLFGNLGLQANYTFIDAKTDAPVPVADSDGDGVADSFERIFRFGVTNYLGMSKHTANLIGIYQDEKLEMRIAYNWRSEYLGSYRDWVTGNPIFQSARGFLDGSVKYELNDMVQFRIQFANILNTKSKAQQQIDAAGQRFGRASFMQDRRIKAGFRLNF